MMNQQYKKLEALIGLPPESRSTLECQLYVDWLRGKSKIFDNVKNENLTEIIRHCKLETRQRDDVIIKQGEKGDTLYISLEGEVEIYVNTKEAPASADNDALNTEILDIVSRAAAMPELDRGMLGNTVFVGRNKTFGEVALVEEDNIRTATVVANTRLVLLTIDRPLFNKCLKGVVAEDMKARTDFVEKNPLFEMWSSRQKRQLVISLTTERVSYGDQVTVQGRQADRLYFIAKGEVEIRLEPRHYRMQYSRIWEEMQTLLPQLIKHTSGPSLTPHEDRKNRQAHQKSIHICQLGVNETLGALEMLLDLATYVSTAEARSSVTLLRLPRSQFERIFTKRRYAQSTIVRLKHHLAQSMCLYIHQCSPLVDAALFKFFNVRLEDMELLVNLRKALNETHDGIFGGSGGLGGGGGSSSSLSAQEQRERSLKIVEMKKRLHLPKGTELSMPAEDMADVVLANLKTRLKNFADTCRFNQNQNQAGGGSGGGSNGVKNGAGTSRESSLALREGSVLRELSELSVSRNGGGGGGSVKGRPLQNGNNISVTSNGHM